MPAKESETSSISTAADAALSNPATGDTLQYDATLMKWKNAASTKVDFGSSQSLTSGQQQTARTNIGALGTSDVQAAFPYNPTAAAIAAMPAGTYYVTGA